MIELAPRWLLTVVPTVRHLSSTSQSCSLVNITFQLSLLQNFANRRSERVVGSTTIFSWPNRKSLCVSANKHDWSGPKKIERPSQQILKSSTSLRFKIHCDSDKSGGRLTTITWIVRFRAGFLTLGGRDGYWIQFRFLEEVSIPDNLNISLTEMAINKHQFIQLFSRWKNVLRAMKFRFT